MYVCLLSRYRLSNCIPKITRACCALQSAVERAFSCSIWDSDLLWIIRETDDQWLWGFVFLTHHQRLNCVDVFISMRTASSVAAQTPVDCSELSQLHQQPVDAVLRRAFIRTLCTSSKLAHLLHTAYKFELFSVSGLKDEKLIKKASLYVKTETHKLYSRVFWMFLPNVIKIDPYNFDLHHYFHNKRLQSMPKRQQNTRNLCYRKDDRAVRDI